MRTLIYKRTHNGDPDPRTGVFGNHDCLGRVRARSFDAVIGVGGIGREPARLGIAGKLNWIGIGPRREKSGPRGPMLRFDHFVYYGENGKPLAELAPHLATHIYDRNVRVLMERLSAKERCEVSAILERAKDAPPSAGFQAQKGDKSRCG